MAQSYPSKNTDYTIALDVNPYLWCQQVYEGTGDAKNGMYLVPNSNENIDTFSKRKQQYRLFPYFTSVIDAMYNDVFNVDPIREYPANEALDKFISNANGKGDNITEVVRQIIVDCITMGMSLTYVDNHSDVDKLTAKEMLDKRLLPYTIRYLPWQIYGADVPADDIVCVPELDVYGNPIYIPIKRVITKDKKDIVYVYRYYADKLDIYEDGNTKFISSEQLPIDSPLILQKWDNTCYLGTPWAVPPFCEIADLTVTYANVRSKYQKAMDDQGFSILYVQTDDDTINVATDNFIKLDSRTTIEPDFASPDPAITNGYREDMGLLREEIYRLAEQAGVSGVSDQSGISKAWDFKGQKTILLRVARLAEIIETKIIEKFHSYFNVTEYEYSVSYNREYQPANESERVTAIVDASTVVKSPESLALLATEAMMIITKAPEDQRNEIYKRELEAQSMSIDDPLNEGNIDGADESADQRDQENV
jgi:hypothetical protein